VRPLRIWLVGFGTVGRWVMRALDCERERLARKYDIEVAVVRAIGQPRSRSFTSGAFRTDSRAAGRSLPTRSRLRACAASSESRRTRRRTRGRSHGRGPSVRDPLTVDAPGGPHRSPVPRAGQAGASSGRRAECRQRSAATASRHRRLMPAGSSKQLQERRPDAPAQTLALACRSKRRWRAIPVHLVCVRRSRLGSVGADDHGPARLGGPRARAAVHRRVSTGTGLDGAVAAARSLLREERAASLRPMRRLQLALLVGLRSRLRS
jgi:hypothetical protein